MKHYALLPLLLATYLLSSATQASSPFGVSQVYSGNPGMCVQSSATNLTCMDSAPIVIAVSLSAQAYPYYYYGNFTAYAPLGAAYADPVGVYGGRCTVESGATSLCYVTLPAIPPTALNGTLERNVSLILASDAYPQVRFTSYLNVSIVHYDNSTERTAVGLYNSTEAQYGTMGPEYAFLCTSYLICNSTIGAALGAAGTELYNATQDLNKSLVTEAYLNTTAASLSLSSIVSSFPAFEAKANGLINEDIAGEDAATNASSLYFKDSSLLYDCDSAYAESIGANISSIGPAPQPPSAVMSAQYLAEATAVRDNITAEIERCSSATASASEASSGPAPTGLKSGKGAAFPYSYLLILPVLVAVVYVIARIRGAAEARRIRDEANKHDSTKQQNGNGKALVAVEPQPGEPSTPAGNPEQKPPS